MADTVSALFKSRRLGHAIIMTIIVTAVEVYGLYLWLGLQLGADPLREGRLFARGILSAGYILFVFLLIEHIISQIDHNKTETTIYQRPQKFNFVVF